MCPVCGLLGPKAPYLDLAKDLLFLNHDIQTKEREKSMSTSDYRRGVEDATKPLTPEDIKKSPLASSDIAIRVYDQIASNRRKSLLTKKVTKWTAVSISPLNGKLYSRGYFLDTEEEAYSQKSNDSSWVGVFPIEIEIPL